MAFKDATMRSAYPRRDGEDDLPYHNRKQKVMDLSRGAVRKYIKDIFDGKKPDPIETITSICNEQYGFTFGNAQKLVNMTTKYMFISTFMDKSKRRKFENCECPMDRKMKSAVNAKNPNLGLKSYFPWSIMHGGKNDVPKVCEEFREAVREFCEDGKMPIEFDFEYWEF